MRTFPSRWHSSATCKEAAKSKRRTSSKTISNFKAMPLSHLKSLGTVVDSHAAAPSEEEMKKNDPTTKAFSLKISRSLGMALYLARLAQPWALVTSSQAGQAGEEIKVRQQASIDVHPFFPNDGGRECIEWKLTESSAEDGLLGRGTTVSSTATKNLIHVNSTAEKEQPMLQELSATELDSGAKDTCGEISDDELNEEEPSIFCRRKVMNARRLRGDFPPPLASLSSRKVANSQGGCVLLQPIRSKGRFMLREMKVGAPRLPFLSIRTNGRLVLQLIQPQELDTHCCSNEFRTSSASAVSEPVDHICLDEMKPAAIEGNTKAEQENYGNDTSLLNGTETREAKGHCKNFPLDEVLEYSKEAAKKSSGSEAFPLDQQISRYKHSELEADWVVYPTDGPVAEGSITAEQIISGEAPNLSNREGNRDTKLPGANRIIHHYNEQADPGAERESTFMADRTRGKIRSSRPSRNIAESELNDCGSTSSRLISNKNECASDNSILNKRNSCSVASRNEAKTFDRGVLEGLQQGLAANHPIHKLSTPNKMLTFSRRPQECAVASS